MVEASIAIAVICTFRDVARRRLVEELKGGDVIDRWVREAIESDHENIKRGLKGIARTDLLSGINNYEDGIDLIEFSKAPVSEVDGPMRSGKKEDDITKLFTAKISQTARKRFKDARKETRRAFNNEDLSVQDRIQATKFSVKAQILESEDNPTEALALCKGYLEKMHKLKEVQSNFTVEVAYKKSPIKNARKEERRKIISSVYEVNRIVFDIVKIVGDERRQFFIWPCVETQFGKAQIEEIDPLRDPRLSKALQNTKEEECHVVRSFGDNILECPHSIATTNQGEFIVVDDKTPRVFGNSGEHLYDLKIPIDKTIQYDIVDVDTDQDCKVYLLVKMTPTNGDTQEQRFEVIVFHKQAVHLRFKLKEESIGRKLAVNSRGNTKTETDADAETEILILEGKKIEHARVEVYDINGKFVDDFGGRILDDAHDIVAASDGHTFILDFCRGVKCVREFNAKRKLFRSFGVDGNSIAITFDQESGHIVTVSAEYDDGVYCEKVSIFDNKAPFQNDYKTERQPVRRLKLKEQGSSPKQNIAVTTKGRIAVALQDKDKRGRVVVV